MAIEFSVTESLPGKREQVFAALTDLDAAPRWMPGDVEIEKMSEGPLAVGSEWRETRKMLGREATEYFEVTIYEPPRRIALRVDGSKGTSGKGEFLFEYVLEPKGEATQVTLTGQIHGLGAVSGLVGKLMAGPMRKAVKKDLEALAQHLRDSERAG
jgi:carbon monoxide dehydrogenase subunit G